MPGAQLHLPSPRAGSRVKSTVGSARVNLQSTPGPIRASARKSLSLNNN